ncbi:MAG: cytidine deaminase [Clostridia bacterium]|nr:cytidine deaminase [Clostridia bacterium]
MTVSNKEESVYLVNKATDAMMKAYAPYSGYFVGAALRCKNGKIYTGCNIENSTYTPTNCAERTAFFKAVSEGEREFSEIAIVGGRSGNIKGFASPCGVCRQVISEFCDAEEFKVLLFDGNEINEYRLKELLPLSFGPSDLNK